MEYCMQVKALKPSLRGEAMKSNQQAFFEDFWCLNGSNVVSSDDFSVDHFLDFSNEEFEDDYINEQEEEEKDFLSISSQDNENDDNNSNSSTLSSDSLLASELAVPVDDLKELEWVSHFVDDSVPEFSLLYPKTETHAKNGSEPEPKPVLARGTWESPPVPGKARTKRTRTTGRVWSLGSPSLSESSSSSSCSSTGFSSTTCLMFTNTVQSMGFCDTSSEPPVKKPRKKPAVQTGGLSGLNQFQRRCSHCQVQKTPQWRTGPLGAKTLCNACGVRYKSGRLFPEYRPACSPTFSGDIHSNSHRKVLEIRKKNETDEPESGLTQLVQSF